MADKTFIHISELPTIAEIGDKTWVAVETSAKVGGKVDLSTIQGGGTAVQSDWNEQDSSKPDYIKNKPDMNEYASKTWVENKHYLVSGDLAGYAKQSDIAEIDSILEEHTTAIEGLESDIGAVSGEVRAVTGTVDGLTGAVDTLTTAVNTLDSTIDSLETTVGTLNTTVSNLETTVGEMGSTVGELSDTVNEVTGTVDSLEDTVSGLSTDVTEVQDTLDTLADAVVQHADAIAELAVNLDAVSGKVDDIEESIEGFVKQDDFDALAGTVDAISGKVDDIEDSLGDYATLTDLESGLETKMNASESANFYPRHGNPDGFLVSADLTGYASEEYVDTGLETKVDKDGDKKLSTNDYTDYDKAVVDLASDVIPADASFDNQLVTLSAMGEAMAEFGGYEVADTDPSGFPVPTGTVSTHKIYLTQDTSVTGKDQYKEWIYDGSWHLVGDTSMSLDGYATEEWVNDQGYATHADLDDYALVSDVDVLSGAINDVVSVLGDHETRLTAVENAVDELDGLVEDQGTAIIENAGNIAQVSGDVDTIQESLTGFAQKSWVESQLGEVNEEIDALATAVDELSGSITGYATHAELESGLAGKLDKAASAEFYPMNDNPAGYLTAHQDLSNYATVSAVNEAIDDLTEEIDGQLESIDDAIDMNTADIAAISGKVDTIQEGLTAFAQRDWVEEELDSVDDALDGISAAVDELSGSVTGYVTQAELETGLAGKLNNAMSAEFYPMNDNPAGYLTAHQDLSDYATTSAVEDAIDDAIEDISEQIGEQLSDVISDVNKNKDDIRFLSGAVDDVAAAFDDYATLDDLEDGLSEKLDKSISGEFYPMNDNPAGYLTTHQDLSDYATHDWVEEQGYAAQTALNELSEIVDAHSESILQNAGDITFVSGAVDDIIDSLDTYATEAYVNDGLSGKVDKIDGMGLSTNDYDDDAKATVDHAADVIPASASVYNQLVDRDSLNHAIADFGGFKVVDATTAGEPAVDEPDTNIIYLTRDTTVTGRDQFREWIWSSGNPEAEPPVASAWNLVGDTSMNLEGYAKLPENYSINTIVAFGDNDTLFDTGLLTANIVNTQSDWNTTATASYAYIQNKPELTAYNLTGDNADKVEVHMGDVSFTALTAHQSLAGKVDVTEYEEHVAESDSKFEFLSAAIGDIPAQVQPDWEETDTTSPAFINNKPVSLDMSAGEGISIVENNNRLIFSVSGDYATAAELAAKLDTTAFDDAMDGIADTFGAIEDDIDFLSGAIDNIPAQVQADWTESDSSSASYIKNKPAELSLAAGKGIDITETAGNIEISVSADYALSADVDTRLADKLDKTDAASTYYPKSNPDNYEENIIDDIKIAGASMTVSNKSVNFDMIPSSADSSHPLVTTTDLAAALANFGGFKVSTGTGSDMHPDESNPDTKTIYLVKDSSTTGSDKYKEWICTDTTAPVVWELIGDTSIDLNGYVQFPASYTAGNIVTFGTNSIADSTYTTADVVNVQPDWEQTVSTAYDYIKNKPEQMTLTGGSYIDITTANNQLTIDANIANISGAMTGYTNVQSDWNESDNTKDTYIANKPDVLIPQAGSVVSATPKYIKVVTAMPPAAQIDPNTIYLVKESVS